MIRILSFLSGVTALAMLVPLILAIAFNETTMITAFALPSGIVLCIALLVIACAKKTKITIEPSSGLMLVSFAWFFSCLLGAFPFYISGHLAHFTDAFFESVSGFTTTGASVFIEVESLPRSLLFWRSMTQWLGGMGLVVLVVAMVPLIGTGGFWLFRGESSGPSKDRVTPKISSTAKILWLIYFSLSVLQTLFLIAGGINWFDAVVITFSTMATGGFSNRNGSIASYNSPWVEWVCIIFMIIAAINFSLLYRLLQGKVKEFFRNSELRAFLGIVFISGLLSALILLPQFNSPEKALRTALFQNVSALSTTGFSVSDHRLWHPLAQGILFLLMFTGACSSSTSGGIKLIRYVILFKQARNEIKKLIYPKGVFSIQLNGKEAPKDVVHGIAGFVFLYFVLVMIATVFANIGGMDLFSSLNTGLLLAGNIGLGIVGGSIEETVLNMPFYCKWVFSIVMIGGRLELWTLFSLLYWVKSKLTSRE